MGETEETLKKWSQLVAQAWADEKLKQQLMDNPIQVLQKHGIDVPAGVDIRVVENTDKVTYLTLPTKPSGGVTELTSGQLAGVGAGAGWCACNVCCCYDPTCIVIGPVTIVTLPKK